MTRVHWWLGDRELTFRSFAADALAEIGAWVVNVLLVFWFGQLAFPAIGLVPPTLLGAFGITGLALVLRQPVTVERR